MIAQIIGKLALSALALTLTAEAQSSSEIIKKYSRSRQAPAVEGAPERTTTRSVRKRSVARPRRKSTAVNLDAMDSAPSTAATPGVSSSAAASPRANSMAIAPPREQEEPRFKMVFDTYLAMRPGVHPLTFRSFHTLLLVEFTPNPDLTFNFEVRPVPRFYEVDYKITPRLQLRVGKIWIPFDDLNPHNSFGGRVNTSPLSQDETRAFLPDIWADLGVGAKVQLLESSTLSLLAHFYIVNGFDDNGTDPTGQTGPYPAFAGADPQGAGNGVFPSTKDNNDDKSIGGRVQATLFNRISLGGSIYTGRYTDEDKESARLLMFGADSQIRFGFFDLKFGYIAINGTLIPPSTSTEFIRGGIYGEGTFRLMERLRFRARVGSSQLDNRVISTDDQTIIGGDLSYNLGMVELGLVHNRDLNTVSGKNNYTFTALRMTLIL